MRINDMARMENFDINKLLGTENNKTKNKTPNRDFYDPSVQADMYTPSNTFFVPPNWSTISSKSDPIMSDEEFEKAIWELGWKDSESDGEYRRNLDYAKLMGAYISVVSPDRKSAYAHTMSMTGGKLPIDKIIYDSDGRRLMHYSPNGMWLPRSTDEEKARLIKFNQIYWDGYNAYAAEHGKPQKI